MNKNKIHILLVKDNKEDSGLIVNLLEKASKKDLIIKSTGNLQEYFKTPQFENTDIVLFDNQLNTKETINSLHKNSPDTPVIVLKDDSDPQTKFEPEDDKFEYIEKSNLTTDLLITNIRHSLETHKLKQQLKIEKQNTRNYLDLAGVIIVSIDTDQNITMINKAACRFLGYSENELLSKNWFDIFSPGKKRQALKENFSKCIAEEKNSPFVFETTIITAAGEHRIISWNRKFTRDKNNNITGVLGSGTDVTAQKISKRTFREISRRIRDHETQKNELIVNLSHELRTPLTIFNNIISNAIAGTSGKINTKLRNEFEMAEGAIKRLAGIITDFLYISEIEAGRMILNLNTIDVCKLVKNAVALHKPLIDSNYMDVDIISPEKPLTFRADHMKLMQILGKLIENTSKFVPDCGGKMTIRITDLDNEIGIDIEDNGPGIKGPDINRIFNRFIQVDRHVGEGCHGTGLGLAITKELVEMHHGRIWVENLEQGGTSFKMTIPKEPPVSGREEPQNISQIEKTIASLAQQADQISGLCDQYLLIDDDSIILKKSEIPLDWELAMKFCGDETVIKKIAKSIIADSPDLMKLLIESVENKDTKNITYAAHKLKGSIQNLGATELPKKAETVEIAAGENDFETINTAMPQLQKEYEKFMKFLTNRNWTRLAQRSV